MPFDRIIPNDYFYVCFPVREEVFERALKWLPVLSPRVASRAEGNICRGEFFCHHPLLITCLESRGSVWQAVGSKGTKRDWGFPVVHQRRLKSSPSSPSSYIPPSPKHLFPRPYLEKFSPRTSTRILARFSMLWGDLSLSLFLSLFPLACFRGKSRFCRQDWLVYK